MNCHNKVAQFGDRCRLCTVSPPRSTQPPTRPRRWLTSPAHQVMNEGVSARYDMFNSQAPQSYHELTRDDSSREERRGRPRDRKTIKGIKPSRPSS